jgi:hypothetical protein
MPVHICKTCGTSFPEASSPPAQCPICEDERQFVPRRRQLWTTLQDLREDHVNGWARLEPDLFQIQTHPSFAIGQRALLVRTPQGNILWDCVALIDDATIELVRGLCGLKAIAISHPHYYTTMVDWSRAFGGIPVYLHAADREWIMWPDPCLEIWTGETKPIAPGLTLLRTGGHFDGGTIMHWAQGCDGRGALLSGDLLQVVADRKHLGFMRSYPNFIPLGASAVRTIAERVMPFKYDAIYGAFWNAVIPENASHAMEVSVARHIEWLEREAP